MSNSIRLRDALEILITRPLDEADTQALIQIAILVWYTDTDIKEVICILLTKNLSTTEICRAGYLLTRLTRFACISDIRANECLAAVRESLPYEPGQSSKNRGRKIDDLAACWGLKRGLGFKVQDILPYQTRHADIATLVKLIT